MCHNECKHLLHFILEGTKPVVVVAASQNHTLLVKLSLKQRLSAEGAHPVRKSLGELSHAEAGKPCNDREWMAGQLERELLR